MCPADVAQITWWERLVKFEFLTHSRQTNGEPRLSKSQFGFVI